MKDLERINDPVYMEVLRIQKRTRDGVNAFETTQAELRLNRLQNNIPDAVYTENVYEPMNPIVVKIRSGNWLDAYNTIDNIIPNDYLTATMLLNYKIQIANYIVGEGEYTEYSGKSVNSETGEIITEE